MQIIYWLDQVDLLWEGRKGFRATVDKEPSMYRLPDLVAYNIPLLGRYNVLVGLIEETSSAPPTPSTPPPPPWLPPPSSDDQQLWESPLVVLAAVGTLGGSCVCALMYWCWRRARPGDKPQQHAVTKVSVSPIKSPDVNGDDNARAGTT